LAMEYKNEWINHGYDTPILNSWVFFCFFFQEIDLILGSIHFIDLLFLELFSSRSGHSSEVALGSSYLVELLWPLKRTNSWKPRYVVRSCKDMDWRRPALQRLWWTLTTTRGVFWSKCPLHFKEY
jgi:hypothetical protein